MTMTVRSRPTGIMLGMLLVIAIFGLPSAQAACPADGFLACDGPFLLKNVDSNKYLQADSNDMAAPITNTIVLNTDHDFWIVEQLPYDDNKVNPRWLFSSAADSTYHLHFASSGHNHENKYIKLHTNIWDGTEIVTAWAPGTNTYRLISQGWGAAWGMDSTPDVSTDTGVATDWLLISQCSSGAKDGDEAGVDCGGTHCSACPPTCSDGIQNQGETGVDCGGTHCTACPTCSDGILNQDETGVDCGGLSCSVCPTCFDGIQNQDETAIDCGGSSCHPCHCHDDTMNGDEIGQDCGGSCSTSCRDKCGNSFHLTVNGNAVLANHLSLVRCLIQTTPSANVDESRLVIDGLWKRLVSSDFDMTLSSAGIDGNSPPLTVKRL